MLHRFRFFLFIGTYLTMNRYCCCFKKGYSFSKKQNLTSKDNYLQNVEYKDTKAFVPPVYSGKVIKVYDGDTITIAAKLPNTEYPVYRFRVRLAGIDSPEIKGKTESEIKLAHESRDALHNLIFGKYVVLKNTSIEKYGRILADIFVNDIHINDWMLKNNYAIPYDGGTKHRPEEWDNL
jgi:endonuclease YncB( thermonuclease family)